MSAGTQTRPPTGGDDVFITYLDQSDSFALGVEFGEFLCALGQGYEAVGGYFSARLEAQLLVATSSKAPAHCSANLSRHPAGTWAKYASTNAAAPACARSAGTASSPTRPVR